MVGKVKYEIEDSMEQQVIFAESRGWARGKREVRDSLMHEKEKAEELQRQRAAAWAARVKAQQQQENEKEQTN